MPAAAPRRRPAGPPSRPVTGPRSQHFLRPAAAADFVTRLGDDLGLVLDIGAGTGRLTELLAPRSERVVAIEADPRLASRLARRTDHCGNVTVVSADFFDRPLPRRPFRVVANLPFSGSTAILRRLLAGDHPLLRADVIVAMGAARGWTAPCPARADAVMWHPWFALELVRRVPAVSFVPPPAVDAAVLSATVRDGPMLPCHHRQAFTRFVALGFAARTVGDALRPLVGRPAVSSMCRRAGVAPSTRPPALPAPAWVTLFRTLNQRA